ncbi:MAG TPA: hypothetical protein VGR25_04665 [bacterium]|jgi:hypothetical protein|nr:hypothetical protein [bacterium]
MRPWVSLLRITVLSAALALGTAAAAAPPHHLAATESATGGEGSYPYGSHAFAKFVADSYRASHSSDVAAFNKWLDETYGHTSRAWLTGQEDLTLAQALAERRRALQAVGNAKQRTQLEIATGAWLHRAVKAMIPHFSLDRGFEFTNTVRLGERQCLLQSVLIAGLLQAVDIDAGVYMVWKNERGQKSNNGHAVTVIKLSDGRDILVDASDREPFMRHRGVFVADQEGRSYRFVEPRYDGDSAITAYRTAAGDRMLPDGSVRPLDVTFLRSQFDYYRGERAPGGFLGRPATAQGLAASARFLERAVQASSQNPLAVYVLGHVYWKQGRIDAAKAQYIKGYRLYKAFGYVPPGPRSAYNRANP